MNWSVRYAQEFKRTNYSGYLVNNKQSLLDTLKTSGIEPKHEKLIAEHITHKYPDKEKAPDASSAEVYGYAHNDGVDALLMRVNGSTHRADGTPYHVTLSVAGGHKPAESGPMLQKALENNTHTPLKPFTIPVTSF